LRPGLADWHLVCPDCAYEGADLIPTINSEDNAVKPDEVEREAGLKTLRQRNFAKIIDSINVCCEVDSPRLLEVGCAHGLFLGLLDDRFQAEGIEPHTPVAQHTRAKGLNVREGYFPQVLSPDETFDIIIFNDVLEHIPDLPEVIEACHGSLNENGILILNLPSSSGILYRLSRVMARTGISGMFERMWQVHYPSPHLHYFNSENLRALIEAHNFNPLHSGRLDTLSSHGLYHRISHTGEYRFPVAMLMYVAAWCAIPLLKLLPADIQLQIFQKNRRQ
jgi:2-polyprenyl-3-methyl-5-hydroxy-6-metoxy-1,4-benzoquinol methylase